jgi:hypothetical protein
VTRRLDSQSIQFIESEKQAKIAELEGNLKMILSNFLIPKTSRALITEILAKLKPEAGPM